MSIVTKAQEFAELSEKNTFDYHLKSTVTHNINHYKEAYSYALANYYQHLEIARQRGATIRNKTIDNLDKHLIDFEVAFTKRGGKVIWALDAEDARNEALKIIERSKAKYIVKSKSNAVEEIGLTEALKEKNIETLETDLGQYIQALCDEKAFHMVLPSMHKSKEEINSLFASKKGLPNDASEHDIMNMVRNELRDKFLNAKIGVTGANYLIAETGSVVITENEGNAFLSVAFPKIHIAVCGIEKIIPSLNDLDLFLPMLSTHATGQQLSVYNHILSGPRQSDETDGPDEMYLILLDNGRTNLLELPEQRRTLSCIKCGACSNFCPVFTHVGGHSYGTVYNGPIGSVINQHLNTEDSYEHLSNASPVCGKCTEVCPVKIDLHKMFLYNRRDNVKKGHHQKSESIYMFFWKTAMLKRSTMEKGGAKVKNFMLRSFFRKSWGERREMPLVQPKSFNQLWREQKGIKS